MAQRTCAKKFQSTPSVGRATLTPRPRPRKISISIHALRGEGDLRSLFSRYKYNNFNPRPPWGGRPCTNREDSNTNQNFNPRPPWGGRHRLYVFLIYNSLISIHALRGEGDLATQIYRCLDINISIHALRGEGDVLHGTFLYNTFISIHALRGEGDHVLPPLGRSNIISIHALRGEGDLFVFLVGD